ncbi:MAG: hypothetical protein Q7S59_09100 [Sulfurimonas sp.]|nr:hypothetical protein [Sulfurimonas sp.]
MNVQVNLGKSTTNSKDFAINFPKPFTPPPVGIPFQVIVLATVVLDGTNYPLNKYTDNFVATVGNVTNTGFTARVTRIDSKENTGWGMNLNLNYIATTNTLLNQGE